MRLMHAGLIVADLERSAHFYEKLLGLKCIARPELGFDGLWYALADGQQLHLMRLDNPYAGCVKPEHGGRDNHIALQCESLDDICRRFDAAGLTYTRSRSGRMAVFVRDPDGNTIELMASG